MPSAKGNPEQLESYKEILSAIPGIESIDARLLLLNAPLKVAVRVNRRCPARYMRYNP